MPPPAQPWSGQSHVDRNRLTSHPSGTHRFGNFREALALWITSERWLTRRAITRMSALAASPSDYTIVSCCPNTAEVAESAVRCPPRPYHLLAPLGLPPVRAGLLIRNWPLRARRRWSGSRPPA